MRLCTKKGEKIVFSKPNSGYKIDQRQAKEFLEEGKEYTVDRLEIGDWHSYVHLKEVPDKSFNSVLFENVETKNCQSENCSFFSDKLKLKKGDVI